MADTLTQRLLITGRVQGVGYRNWCVQTSRKLGLVGWVRNLTDGSVEVLVQGPHHAVERLIADCHVGPPGARVNEVSASSAASLLGGDGFLQMPTADSRVDLN